MDPNRLALIDGLPPLVRGRTCREFVLCGELREGFARTWIRIGVEDRHYCFWFRERAIVWREGLGPGQEHELFQRLTTEWSKDIGHELRLLGRRMTGLSCRATEEGCEVGLTFDESAPPEDERIPLPAGSLYHVRNPAGHALTRVLIRFDGEEISWEAGSLAN